VKRETCTKEPVFDEILKEPIRSSYQGLTTANKFSQEINKPIKQI
jgi:hypothetical protein